MALNLTLRPHIERGGYHIDRFDAYVGEELICTSRSGWHTPARALLTKGYPPEILLHVQHEGTAFDPTIVPQTLGELAKWTIAERDRAGLHRERWEPFDKALGSFGIASPASDVAEAAD